MQSLLGEWSVLWLLNSVTRRCSAQLQNNRHKHVVVVAIVDETRNLSLILLYQNLFYCQTRKNTRMAYLRTYLCKEYTLDHKETQ